MSPNLPILLFIAMTLAACGSEPEPDATAGPAVSAPLAPASKPAAPADPLAKMARAVGNGKPGAAVDIRYDIVSKPEVGKPTEVDLAFVPRAGVETLDATISGMEGITLAGDLTASFTQVEADKPYEHSFSLLPDRTGVFYLTISVNTQISGSTLGRTFSIPFVVGSAPAQQKSAVEPQKDATGQAVQPMKAEETSR